MSNIRRFVSEVLLEVKPKTRRGLDEFEPYRKAINFDIKHDVEFGKLQLSDEFDPLHNDEDKLQWTRDKGYEIANDKIYQKSDRGVYLWNGKRWMLLCM